jgi:hypothetical protein
MARDTLYNVVFVEKINKSKKDYRANKGKVVTVSDLEKLWK